MNIPGSVRIGSSDYEVNLSEEILVLNGQQCKGTIDYDYHQIKISSGVQDKQGQEQTFLHEMIHGIIRERNLDVKNSEEESIVEEIALGLHQVIRDNVNIFIKEK